MTPNSALLDGQQVNVSGTGFTAGAQIAVIECTVGATSENDCDTSTLAFVSADTTGNVTTTYTVYRQLFPANAPGGLDCAPTQCRITIANIVTQTEAASTTLNFDASVPLPPTLQISAAIDPSAAFDKAGNVTVTGTVTCNRLAQLRLVLVALDVFGTVNATVKLHG